MCNKTRSYVSKILKIVGPIIRIFIDHSKDLKAIIIMFIQKKLIKLHKRQQTYDKITTYPYGTHVFKVCESEMLTVKDLFLKKLQ